MNSWLYSPLCLFKRVTQRLFGASTMGVKGLVINPQQEVLLVEHTYIAGWHLPGGGVDYGESPKAALIRELKEEAGLQVKAATLFGIYAHKIHGAADFPVLYIVKDFEAIPGAHLSQEIKQVQWFAVSKLPRETTVSTHQRLKEYFQGLEPAEHW